jgi:hypothetical protein
MLKIRNLIQFIRELVVHFVRVTRFLWRVRCMLFVFCGSSSRMVSGFGRNDGKDRRGAAVLAADKRHVLRGILGDGLQQIRRQKRTRDDVVVVVVLVTARLLGFRDYGRNGHHGALDTVPWALARRAHAVVRRSDGQFLFFAPRRTTTCRGFSHVVVDIDTPKRRGVRKGQKAGHNS